MNRWSVYARPGRIRAERGAWGHSAKSSGVHRELAAVVLEERPGRFRFYRHDAPELVLPYASIHCLSEEFETTLLTVVRQSRDLEDLRYTLEEHAFQVVDGPPRTPYIVRL